MSSQVRIFFSWQSVSPKETNSNAIRKALRNAEKKLKIKYPDVQIINDEATRDTAGSPNIALKIIEKVEEADIFVGDITTITGEGVDRACPNPNVVFELGYAAALLGWDRIILLFNEAYGNFPQDVPFDFSQHRINPYTLDSDALGKGEDAGLTDFLVVAIGAVLEKNPKRATELRGMSVEKVKHERDTESIRWLLSQIHVPTLDEHIQRMPQFLSHDVLWYWEGFRSVLNNSLFHLYDQTLNADVLEVYRAWAKTLAFHQHYDWAPSGKGYIFTNSGTTRLDPKRDSDWNEISSATDILAKALRRVLDRVRAEYLGVDIIETNAKAYHEHQRDEAKNLKYFGK